MNLSVVIPAHNASCSIVNSVRSAREQSARCDVVVVADACDDDTASLAERAGARVFEAHFKNVAHARNLGVEKSLNAQVAFLDADDRYLSDWARTLSKHFANDADFVFANVRELNPDDTLRRESKIGQQKYENPSQKRMPKGRESLILSACEAKPAARALLYQNFITTSASAISRRAFDALGGFRATFHNACEDLDLWLRVAEKYQLVHEDRAFAEYVHSKQSAVRSLDSLQHFRTQHLRVLDDAFERQGTRPAYAEKCIANAYRQSTVRALVQGNPVFAKQELKSAERYGLAFVKSAPLWALLKMPRELSQQVRAFKRALTQ